MPNYDLDLTNSLKREKAQKRRKKSKEKRRKKQVISERKIFSFLAEFFSFLQKK